MTTQINNRPLVSVLMNCYNGEQYIAEAIQTVLDQTYQNWEIIFWDNASTDRSAEIAQSYGDPRIKYFLAEENIPLYAARDLAIKKVTGEIVGFLDVDDKWLPTKLEKQVPLFENEKVGIVFSDTLFFNNDGKILSQYYQNTDYSTGMCFRHLLRNYFLSLETVLIRKTALDEQPYAFDKRFNMIGDADLFRRIGFSWELDMVNETLGMWRVDKNSMSWTQTNKFFSETEQMLESYNDLFKNFENEYREEIHHLRNSLEIGRAKVSLRNGDCREARKFLKPLLKEKSKKVLALYSVSYLPSFIVKVISKNRL